MKSLGFGLAAIALLCLPHAAAASPINTVAYASLTGGGSVTFEGLAPGSYDGIMTSEGQQFAERFAGQTAVDTLTDPGFDTLTGSPSPPLTLAAGVADHNLFVLDLGGNQVLTGLGPANGATNGSIDPPDDAIGEGSFAVLFANDQSQFGFKLVGGESDLTAGATVAFFRRDGSLIDTITLLNLLDGGFGFIRDGGVKDIAGISIFNNDPGGIGFDDLIFDVPADTAPVPEPSTLVLLGIGGLFVVRRVRR